MPYLRNDDRDEHAITFLSLTMCIEDLFAMARFSSRVSHIDFIFLCIAIRKTPFSFIYYAILWREGYNQENYQIKILINTVSC